MSNKKTDDEHGNNQDNQDNQDIAEILDLVGAISAAMEAEGIPRPSGVRILTPQFHRGPDDPKPVAPPTDRAGFKALSKLPIAELRAMGLGQWNDPSKPDKNAKEVFRRNTLMLLPGEWYDAVPDGTVLHSIDGDREVFLRGETDNDIRYGCLAYGVLVPVTDTGPAAVGDA